MIVSRSSAEIRLASLADADAIREIYNVEVTESTVTFDLVPRTREMQEEWLREHAGAHPAVVVTEDGVVVGFGCLGPYRPRPAYATTVENSDLRPPGPPGPRLRTGAARRAAPAGDGARVPRGHRPDRRRPRGVDRLHQKCGFDMVGVEREVGRKFGRWLDVVVMQRLL